MRSIYPFIVSRLSFFLLTRSDFGSALALRATPDPDRLGCRDATYIGHQITSQIPRLPFSACFSVLALAALGAVGFMGRRAVTCLAMTRRKPGTCRGARLGRESPQRLWQQYRQLRASVRASVLSPHDARLFCRSVAWAVGLAGGLL